MKITAIVYSAYQLSPDVVYFDEGQFTFAVKLADRSGIQTKIPGNIHRESFGTAFGLVKDKAEEFKLTLDLVDKLQMHLSVFYINSRFNRLALSQFQQSIQFLLLFQCV